MLHDTLSETLSFISPDTRPKTRLRYSSTHSRTLSKTRPPKLQSARVRRSGRPSPHSIRLAPQTCLNCVRRHLHARVCAVAALGIGISARREKHKKLCAYDYMWLTKRRIFISRDKSKLSLDEIPPVPWVEGYRIAHAMGLEDFSGVTRLRTSHLRNTKQFLTLLYVTATPLLSNQLVLHDQRLYCGERLC